MSSTKILFLDIETAPNVAYVWGLFDQNISPNQVKSSSYVLCWSAKWHGRAKMEFCSVQRHTSRAMLASIHRLLDEADIVVHFNGIKFDIPTLNKEFVKHDMLPPSPYKQIDMLRICRQAFRFESNKLESVSFQLGIGKKVKHYGFELWTDCMDGKQEAWRIMERYNRMDVTILERLYHRLLPWITKHPIIIPPHVGLTCPKCGSNDTQLRGSNITRTAIYARHQCQKCGGWFRSSKPTVRLRDEHGVNA